MAAAFDRVPPADVEEDAEYMSDDEAVVVEAHVRAAILLDPNTIMSRIQRRLPNTPLPSFELDSITSQTNSSSVCLLCLAANTVSTLLCNDLLVCVAQINALRLPRELDENAL